MTVILENTKSPSLWILRRDQLSERFLHNKQHLREMDSPTCALGKKCILDLANPTRKPIEASVLSFSRRFPFIVLMDDDPVVRVLVLFVIKTKHPTSPWVQGFVLRSG